MANTLAATMRGRSSLLIQALFRQTRFSVLNPQAIRTLYSPATLGIDSYLQQKDRTVNQLRNIAPKFREKMKEYSADDSKSMVFTEDLKNMLHLADNDEDIELVINMLKRFNKQNKQLRFGNYVFGPVVMRMFYALNKPEEAYQCFKDPELEGFFDQLMTYQVLLDLLYENRRYGEMLETFKLIRDKQIEGIKFARNVIVLTYAACYKINTKDSWDFAIKLWGELQEIGHLPMRKATTFCAGLALNQGRPDAALEILSSARNQNYTTIRNIKVAALTDMGRVEDAIPVLKSIIHEDSASVGPVQTFNRDVLEQVQSAIEKLDNPELKLEFSRIEKYFQEQGHICETTLEVQLSQEIASPPVIGKRTNSKFVPRNQYSSYKGYPESNQRDGRERTFNRPQRPGLSDL